MEDGLVFNAMDGAKKLGISPDELGKKYDALKKGETIIKFGGGFYCGKVDDIYAARTLIVKDLQSFLDILGIFHFVSFPLVLLESLCLDLSWILSESCDDDWRDQ